MKKIVLILIIIPFISYGSFPIKKVELISIEKNNFVSSEVNTLYNTDSSQKFIDWSKIPKFLFLPIPPIPLILIVYMFFHGNSSARALIISLSILSLLFGLLLINWANNL